MPPTLGAKPRLERQRESDADRRNAHPWRSWYGLKRWKLRRFDQLSEHPFCSMCEAEGTVELATVVDHKVPHRGEPALFWDGELDSLCKRHHDGAKQRAERQRSSPR